jgi:hypothetical protein
LDPIEELDENEKSLVVTANVDRNGGDVKDETMEMKIRTLVFGAGVSGDVQAGFVVPWFFLVLP